MKNRYFNILFIIIMLTFASCKKNDITKVVTAVTGTILEPVSITVTPREDLGEIVVGEDPVKLVFKIKNNSSDNIRKIKLVIDKNQSLLKFKEDNLGEITSPGYEGTCQAILSSGSECTFVLSFTPRKSGVFTIPVVFNYENLIEPQQKTVTITALTGEPASLVFTNDISNYELDVVEQTEKTKRFLDLKIANKGGLSARNIITQVINSDASEAFQVISNSCNKDLLPTESCDLKLSYEPHNNNYTDPMIEYKSQLILNYKRDSKGTESALNGYASFMSAAVEARFDKNFKILDFEVLFAGNKASKSVRISNVGYRAGIIKEMIINDYQGNYLTTCKKAATGKNLECAKSLQDFPFIIEDLNSCLENEVMGIVGKAAGQNCFFTFTYWPSLTWESGTQSLHYFNELKVSLKYDSRWKSEENIIIQKDMFEIFADFLSAGKLSLNDISIENIPVDSSKIKSIEGGDEVDIGRLALVSSDIYSKYIKITWKNIGENVVSLDQISDNHSPTPKLITELGYDLNSYYKQIKTSADCSLIAPGATCNISFSLAPVIQANSALEDQLMFDDISNVAKKIKTFIIKYNDGSKFEDNGNPANLRQIKSNLIAKLIKKGSLAFTSPLTVNTSIINGNSTTKSLCLSNVGTGDIYAIINNASENLYSLGNNSWPYKVQDLVTVTSSCPTPAIKDCYDIIFPNTASLPMDPDTSKFLGAGETCVLSFEARAPDSAKKFNFTIDEDYKRPFSPILSNTEDAWQRTQARTNSTLISFNYYDGDYVSADSNSFLNYGYQGSTKKTSLNFVADTPASIVLMNPLPLTSAVLARPAIIYPTLNTTFPIAQTLTGRTVPESFFTYSYFSQITHPFTKSEEAINYVKSLNLSDPILNTEYKVHIGSFPVGQTIEASFDYTNTGEVKASDVTLTPSNDPTSPIQIQSFFGIAAPPYPPLLTISKGQIAKLKILFTPTVAGVFKRCFTLNYFTGLADWSHYTCVYAQAVASAPKLKIEYSDVEIAVPGPTETLSGVYTALNAPMNKADTTFAFFSEIKGTNSYAKKIFRITNYGSQVAKKLNYYIMDSESNAKTSATADIIVGPTSSNGCSINMSLPAGTYCEIYIKYKPSKSSLPTLTRYLGFIYEIIPDSSQYVTQVSGIRFTALDPAKLAVINTTAESIYDWSNPLAPLPVGESWPLDLKMYNRVTNPHFLLYRQPEEKEFPVITIKNFSTLKASFLIMNSTPAAGTWNQIIDNSFVNVTANRACFYGDDESNPGIPESQKGFNASSIAVCNLTVKFKGSHTYAGCSSWNAAVKSKTIRIGNSIESSCNPFVFKLNYYNNNRSSYDEIFMHAKGYIEPNRSTTLIVSPAPTFSNVTSTYVSGSTGKVTFSWPELFPMTPSWGSITKYRIYYDISPSNLNGDKVFKLTGGPAYFDTADSNIRNITISNLAVGKYYYFKVMTVRNYDGINYISDSNIPLLTLPIPASDYVYDHSSRSLIDKTYMKVTGNRPNGITTCGAKFYDTSISGSRIKTTKSLVTTPMWNTLISNPALSIGYPPSGIGSLPHWLGDPSYNIATRISLYDGTILPGFPGYTPAATSGTSIEHLAIFQKTCNNVSSCDMLFKVVGGDDVDLYFQGVYYAKDTAISAFYRCGAIMRCPTSTTKVITDVSCALP